MFCKATLRDIGREHGEDHLRLVFMLMTGTPTNAAELYSDMIRAVSALVINMPGIEKRSTLVADFDRIDLGSLRRQARSMRCGIPTSHVLRVLLRARFVNDETVVTIGAEKA